MSQMLIVGLGNPGSQYLRNRHNIGFMVLDELAKDFGISFKEEKKFFGQIAKVNNLILLKPTTFMNNSGKSVSLVKNYFNIENMIVIHDELDIGFGNLKFKFCGSSGGHNGLKSIDLHCEKEYTRIRCGIGRPTNGNVVDYVLSDFDSDQNTTNLISSAKDATMSFIQGKDLLYVQNHFTTRN